MPVERAATRQRGVKPLRPASCCHWFALSQLWFCLLSGARTPKRRNTTLIDSTEVKTSHVTISPYKNSYLYVHGLEQREGQHTTEAWEELRILFSVMDER